MSTTAGLTSEWGTVVALWRRDMLHLIKERSRWFGVILQPLIFWLIIGSGLDQNFTVEGVQGLDYREYTFPGILVMVILFTTIFATISVVEDRQSGFLQGVLVGPGSRGAMVIGKILGVTTLTLVQSAIFVAFAPLAGYAYGAISWLVLLPVVILTTFGLTAVGFTMAWALNSTQAYHAVMSVLLLPLWILSGAMFPPQGNWVDMVMWVNPMSYAVSAVRGALLGVTPPQELGPSMAVSVLFLIVFGCVAIAGAIWVCRRSAK